ncbi:hypothetical protein GN244_ATG20215 [Phytophthora infestans]|uniref:Uncharacterized protein n=1 Tax=Phytophthora infestans TaxID=4787 RepID=A0A833SP55_PHYIN|nr:hypothetical protein GN244_ATG20215 [Phytophthora infestans]
MFPLKLNPDESLNEDLAKAISKMEKNDSIALLLEHEYTENSKELFGSKCLKGANRARFRAPLGANTFAATDKKLRFFMDRLLHGYSYKTYDEDEEIDEHVERIN